MVQTLERIAEFVVARACGFAALAIFTVMVGFAWDPVMALQTGGILTLLACAILLLKGGNAPGKPYTSTELWIILPKDQRPRPEFAQQLVGNVMREAYFRFAQRAALLSALMLSTAVLLAIVGIKPASF